MLDKISKQIHEVAVEKAAKYLVAEAELLRAIIEVDRHKLYEKFSETYLTPYCVKYLNLSEDVAAMFVRVARKSQQVPELGLAVQEGLQMSKARTIASVIDTKNKDEWIEKAQTFTKEKLEREVAAANPSAPKPEKAKPVGPDRFRIEFEVTSEEHEILKRARELMSQKKSKPAHIGETILVATKEWVDREDPVCKAERAQRRKEKKSEHSRERVENRESQDHLQDSSTEIQDPSSYRSQDRSQNGTAKQQAHASNRSQSHWQDSSARTPLSSSHRSHRSAIPVGVRHQVHLRDRGACRKRMPDGSNCGCRKWTDIHHILPKAYGGTDTLENLITLCKAHHRQLHERSA